MPLMEVAPQHKHMCMCAQLTRVVIVPWNLPEAIVERQVMPNGILPSGLAAPVEWEIVRHEGVDLAEGESASRCSLDRHRDECRV